MFIAEDRPSVIIVEHVCREWSLEIVPVRIFWRLFLRFLLLFILRGLALFIGT